MRATTGPVESTGYPPFYRTTGAWRHWQMKEVADGAQSMVRVGSDVPQQTPLSHHVSSTQDRSVVGEGPGVREKIRVPRSKSSSPGLVGHPLPESVGFCDAGRSRGEQPCRVRSKPGDHPGLATTPSLTESQTQEHRPFQIATRRSRITNHQFFFLSFAVCGADFPQAPRDSIQSPITRMTPPGLASSRRGRYHHSTFRIP